VTASAPSPAAFGSARGAATGDTLSATSGGLSAAGAPSPSGEAPSVVVKVALVGDAGIGKTSLMVRYVHRSFAQTAATLGVDFLERVIELPQARVTLSIWDLGGSFQALLPMVTQDAVAVAFLFDPTLPSSLHSVRSWYRDVRALNKAALPFLVGTKHDALAALPAAQQAAVLDKARGYAKAMRCPLLLTSAATGLNINALFKLVFQMAFGLEIDVKRSETVAF
jgi:GTP-binding protein of the ras superfamily involved in termination of M-phase